MQSRVRLARIHYGLYEVIMNEGFEKGRKKRKRKNERQQKRGKLLCQKKGRRRRKRGAFERAVIFKLYYKSAHTYTLSVFILLCSTSRDAENNSRENVSGAFLFYAAIFMPDRNAGLI